MRPRRVAAGASRHRHCADARTGAYAGRRGSARPRFPGRYCVGYPIFEHYLLGRSDGQPKNAAWAAAITGIRRPTSPAWRRRMAAGRTLIVVAHVAATRRARRATGLDGGGAGGDAGADRAARRRLRLRLGSLAQYGKRLNAVAGWPTLPQGRNSVPDFIPVARIADMLLNPGEASTTTAAADLPATSGWSTGRAATRSTTTRISTGCAARLPGRIRWSCTRPPGPRRRATPTSCCPAP